MKIISIGTESKVFKEGRVRERILEYGNFCDQYISYVFTNKSFTSYKKDNLEFYSITSSFKFISFLKLFLELKKFKKQKDVIIYSQDTFEIGALSYLVAKVYGYKLCLQIHTDVSSKYFRFESVRNFCQWVIFRLIVKHGDSVRVVSEKIKKYLLSIGVNEQLIFVAPIYAGDILDRIKSGQKENSTLTPLKDRENVILMLSRIEKVKNIPLGIEAFKILQKQEKYKNYVLIIVGEGSQKKYLIEKYKDIKNIVWEKWSERPEENFSKAKIFLLTSRYEGWGMSPIESVSCGTPVVMTDVGCANEFIFNNLNGNVVSKQSKKEVAKMIEFVLENLRFYNIDKLKNSLNILQTKQTYLDTLQKCWQKTLL
jgi:glycosyltransferase involved in cell wall biosynthesis